MSDDSKATWTDREIVLEFFPGTDERLVPRGLRYRLEDGGNGTLRIVDRAEGTSLRLDPLAQVGNPIGHLCCDLCGRMSTRRFLRLYRAPVAGSGGRRFRYVSACREHRACDARRVDDSGIEALLTAGA